MLATAAIIAALVVVVLITSGGGSGHGTASADAQSGAATNTGRASTTAAPTAAGSARGLMHAAATANATSFSKGVLPPSSCMSTGSTVLTCINPAPMIAGVRFETYPSLTALYAGYTHQFKTLSGLAFKANRGVCNAGAGSGEAAWNHDSKQPLIYSVKAMMAGTVNVNDAFGRVFCTFSARSGAFYIGWTNDPDRLFGLVTGNPHDAVYRWWHEIHHTFSLSGDGMAMNMGQ